MSDLVVRPYKISETGKVMKWCLQIRRHGLGETEYHTLATGDETWAHEVVNAGAPFWLYDSLPQNIESSKGPPDVPTEEMIERGVAVYRRIAAAAEPESLVFDIWQAMYDEWQSVGGGAGSAELDAKAFAAAEREISRLTHENADLRAAMRTTVAPLLTKMIAGALSAASEELLVQIREPSEELIEAVASADWEAWRQLDIAADACRDLTWDELLALADLEAGKPARQIRDAARTQTRVCLRVLAKKLTETT